MKDITRKEFLGKLGIGAAFALTATCLGSCTKDTAAEPIDVDFMLDLNDPANAALRNNGGYVISEGVVVARSLSGAFIAATVTCSHNQYDDIIYQDGIWFCTRHAAEFEENGEGLNMNGKNGLTVYTIEDLGDNKIRIYSE